VASGSNGAVVVQSANGSASLSGFLYQAPPTISSINPSIATSGTAITITGADLTGTSMISFGGTNASSFTVLSSTTIRAIVGSGSSGSVSLVTPSGVASITGFVYQPVPIVTSIAPTSGAAGTVITITGTNFNGVTGVSIGGLNAASFNVLSSTTLTAIVGAGASGAVVVTNSTGAGSFSGFSFLAPAPIVTSFSPASAVVGSTITITGSNFNTDPSANIVFFGAVKANVLSATETALTVMVPSGASHDAITVLNTAPALSGYSQKNFLPLFDGGGATINFASKTDFTTGTYPFRVAASDLNNDGKTDVVVVNQNANTVSVYKSTSTTGSVSFAAKVDFATGNKPSGLAIADINGDGKPDIIAGNYNSNTVSVLLNTGSGGTIAFATKVDFATGAAPYGIAVTDVDKDGRPDIVAANANSNTVSVLRNTSTLSSVSFASRVDFAVAAYPMSLVVLDLEEDGKPDIAVINQVTQTISLLRNTSSQGSISFTARIDVTAAGSPVAGGDIDGDGKADLIISNPTATAYEVLRNASTPGVFNFGFGNGASLNPAGVTALTLNDFNGDGKIDLGIGSDGNNAITIIRNNSIPGTFQYGAKTMLTPGSSPQGITNGDIDGDGKPDLLVVNAGSNTVSVFRNTTTPPPPPVITSVAPLSAAQGAAMTITGSNFIDVADVKLGGTSAASFTVLSSTTISVTVGSGSSGSISVTTTGGTAGLSGFIFLPAPTIDSIAPGAGISGTAITITGNNFSDVANVSFGGVNASSFTVLSSTTIQAIVGNGASGNVVVQTPGGTAIKAGFIYQILPTITAISPATAGTGTAITITGADLTGATAVSFGGVNATSFTVISSTTIQAVVGVGNSGMVSVQTPAGIGTLNGFTYQPIPVVASFTPVSGTTGTPVTITGHNFTGVTGVSFGGIDAASFTVQSSDTIVAVVGTGATGPVSLTSSDGTGIKSGFNFIPLPPVITAINPASAVAGSLITITGNYFGNNVASNTVFFGAVKATVQSASATQLVVVVPSGASYNAITVLNTASGLSGYSQKNFLPVFDGAGASVRFAARQDFVTGALPFRTATSDLDNDGKPDVIVVNQSSNSISIYKNTGIAQTISFAAKLDYNTNNKPAGVAIGDINRDGKPDIIVGNYDAGNVSVFINTYSGGGISFATKVDFVTGAAPYGITVNDIDMDGKPDIIVANANSNTVSVLRNTGTLNSVSFTRRDLATGSYPMYIRVADFDEDGKPDIATINQVSGTVTLYRNTSSDTLSFDSRNDLNLNLNAGMSSGDIDGDGKTDILLSKRDASGYEVLRNTSTAGSISFATGNSLLFDPGGVTGFTVHDFNGDTKIDIVVGSDGYNTLSVIPNKSIPGLFEYGTKLVLTPGNSPQEITSGDLDGDGRPDILVVNALSNTMSVFRNITTPPVPPAINTIAPLTAGQGATLTVTGANFEDIIAVNIGGTNAVSFTVLSATTMTVVVGTGSSGTISVTTAGGTAGLSGFVFVPVPAIASVSPGAGISGTTITITGTDFTDVSVVSFGGINAASFNVLSSTVIEAVVGNGGSGAVVVQTPGGTATKTGFIYQVLPTITAISPASAGTGVSITITGADFTGATGVSFGGVNAGSFTVLSSTVIRATVDSGKSGDVVVQTPAGTGSISGFTYQAIPFIASITPTSGTDGTAITITGYNFTGVSAVSIGGVSAASFSVLSSTTIVAIVGSGGSGSISVTNADGTASKAGFIYTPSPPLITSITPASAVAGATITITGNYFGHDAANNIVFFGAVKATILSASSTQLRVVVPAGASYQSLTVLNTVSGLSGYSQKNFLPVFDAGGANIRFAPKQDFVTGALPFRTVTSDLDGDGKPDVIVVNQNANTISVYKNTSIGQSVSFASTLDYATGNKPAGIATADFNGDGKPDLVAGNYNSGNVSVYLNTSSGGTVSLATKVDFATGAAPYGITVNDMDMDGKPDIIVANANSNTVSVLRNTGSISTVAFTKLDLNAGSYPMYVRVADLDEDGKPDIVTINQVSGAVSIYRNISFAGTLSFASRIDLNLNLNAGMSIGDIDGDGKIDILLSKRDASGYEVLRNTSTTGNISFAAGNSLLLDPAGVTGFTLHDFNGDNKVDIAVGSDGYNVISVIPNNSTPGSFQYGTKTLLSPGNSPQEMTSGDLDGDGRPDLLVVNAVSNTMSVFRNITGPAVPPVITSVAPLTTGRDSTLSITGSGFIDVLEVKLGGVNAASFNVVSSTLITAVVGTGASGTISVTTAGGTAGMSGFVFVPAPSISAVSPTTAISGTTITITGSNFTGATIVSFGGVGAAFTVLSSTSIQAVVANGASGDVLVQTIGGTASKPGFVYLGQPTITSISPASGGTGASITITGTDFTGAMSVIFGGVSAKSFTLLSSTVIRATVDSGNSGTVVVHTPAGTGSIDGFTYLSTPFISSIAPVATSTNGTITITGVNFVDVRSVSIGGTPAVSFNVLSATTIVAVVGNGSSGNITVVTGAGTASRSGFIFVPPVYISGISSICAGGNGILQSSAASGNQWYRNDTLIPGAVSAAYTVTTTGKYKVVVKFDTLSLISNSIDVRLRARPVAGFTVNDGASRCMDSSYFAFTNTSSIPDNAARLFYRWSFGDGSATTDLKNPLHNYAGAGSYLVKLVVTSDSSCQDSVVQTILIKPKPKLVVQQPAAICNTTGALTIDISAAALFAGSDAGLSFSFWKDSLSTQKLTDAAAVSASGTYWVRASDASGCFAVAPVKVTMNALPVVASITGDNTVCVGSTIQLSNATANGVWRSSDPLSLTIDNTGKATGKQPGTFSISYTYTNPLTGCTNASGLTVTVNASPIAGRPLLVGYASDTLACFDNTLLIAAGNTYDKYLWSTGATTSFVTISNDAAVSLKVGSNQSNCYSEPSVVVTTRKNMTPKPVISRQGDKLLSSNAVTYKWFLNNKPTGDTLSQISIGLRGAYSVNTSIDRYCWTMSDDYIVFFDQVAVKKVFDLVTYPNPTSGAFNLQLNFERNVTALIRISITNQAGVTVWTGNKLIFNDKSTKIPVSVSLVKGIYTVKVEVGGESVSQQLVVM